VPGAIPGWGEAYKYAKQSIEIFLGTNFLALLLNMQKLVFSNTESGDLDGKNIDEKDKEFRSFSVSKVSIDVSQVKW